MARVQADSKIIDELNDLINQNIDVSLFPYKKGNSIRIGSFAIRKKKSQYIVINCKENKIVEQCFSQPAAIAIAKRMSKGDEGRTNDIMLLDQQLQKNFVDCIFYSHTIENTKDLLKREASFDRYVIAKYRVEDATAALECHIFR